MVHAVQDSRRRTLHRLTASLRLLSLYGHADLKTSNPDEGVVAAAPESLACQRSAGSTFACPQHCADAPALLWQVWQQRLECEESGRQQLQTRFDQTVASMQQSAAATTLLLQKHAATMSTSTLNLEASGEISATIKHVLASYFAGSYAAEVWLITTAQQQMHQTIHEV